MIIVTKCYNTIIIKQFNLQPMYTQQFPIMVILYIYTYILECCKSCVLQCGIPYTLFVTYDIDCTCNRARRTQTNTQKKKKQQYINKSAYDMKVASTLIIFASTKVQIGRYKAHKKSLGFTVNPSPIYTLGFGRGHQCVWSLPFRHTHPLILIPSIPHYLLP